jgi:cell division protein FtsA
MMSLIYREIVKSGFEDALSSGVVITGGASIMEGMPELAEKVFGMPARRGIPQGIGGLVDIISSPIYATGVGLVLYGAKQDRSNKFKIRETNVYYKVKDRMKDWIEEFF